MEISKDRRYLQGYIVLGVNCQTLEVRHADVLKREGGGIIIPPSPSLGSSGRRKGDTQLSQPPRHTQHIQNLGHTLPPARESMMAVVQVSQVGE